MEITMQNFSSIRDVKKWFNNRYLDSEVAYIKSKDQMVLLSTKSANTELNIKSGTRLLISDDIITLEQKLLKYKKDAVVMEIHNSQIIYLAKHLIQIAEVEFILVETIPYSKFSLREIIKPKAVKPVNYKARNQYNNQVEFLPREKEVMYLLVNNFTPTEIGEVLFLCSSTIRSYITFNIKSKLETLGYLVPDRKAMITIYKSLGYADTVPDGILKILKPTTIICEL